MKTKVSGPPCGLPHLWCNLKHSTRSSTVFARTRLSRALQEPDPFLVVVESQTETISRGPLSLVRCARSTCPSAPQMGISEVER